MHVTIGSTIARGTIIGTVGNAGARYPAHLHMEMHDSSGIFIGGGYRDAPGDRPDPTKVIANFQQLSPDSFTPSILDLAIEDQLKEQQNTLSIQSSELAK